MAKYSNMSLVQASAKAIGDRLDAQNGKSMSRSTVGTKKSKHGDTQNIH